MNEATRALVRRRAEDRCEYCQLRQADSLLAVLHVEHIIPRKHGGPDTPDNPRSPVLIAISTKGQTFLESILRPETSFRYFIRGSRRGRTTSSGTEFIS